MYYILCLFLLDFVQTHSSLLFILCILYIVFLYSLDKINVRCEVNSTGAENTTHSHTTQLSDSQQAFSNSQTVHEPIISEQTNTDNEVQKYEDEEKKGNMQTENMVSTNISQETSLIVNVEGNVSTTESDKGKISLCHNCSLCS